MALHAQAWMWVLVAGAVHLLIFWFVTSGPPLASCINCTAGHPLSAADVRYYFEETSPGRPREAALAEYPPLAKLVIMAPRLVLVGPDLTVYLRAFELEMLLADLFILLAVAAWSAATAGAAAVPRRVAWFTAYVAVLSPLAYTRFDLVPTALAFASALAWGSGRPALGAVASALGTLTKLFPGSLAAVGFVHEIAHRNRTRMRGTLVFAVALPALTALTWTFGGHALFGSYLERKLQIESALAGIMMAGGRVAGLPMTLQNSHGAVELAMRGTRVLAALTLPLQGALLGATLYAVWRSRTSDFVRYGAAAILGLIVPGKVLSPQYLIWLTPFLSVLDGGAASRTRWLFLAACLATTVIFPFAYSELADFRWWAIGLLNLRNMLLLGCFLLLLGAPAARGRARVRSDGR